MDGPGARLPSAAAPLRPPAREAGAAQEVSGGQRRCLVGTLGLSGRRTGRCGEGMAAAGSSRSLTAAPLAARSPENKPVSHLTVVT
jgi:hypothetical protein